MAEGIENSGEQSAETAGHLSGLVNLLLLGFINRFNFNYQRYRETRETVDEGKLVSLCEQISYKLFAYENALSGAIAGLEDEPENDRDFDIASASLLVLAKQIYDLLYRLHHDMLELPVDKIAGLIPDLDKLISDWNHRQENPFIHVENDIKVLEEIKLALLA